MKIVKTVEPCGVAIMRRDKKTRIFRFFEIDDEHTAQEIQKFVGTATDVLIDEKPLFDVDCKTVETAANEFYCTLSVKNDEGDEIFFSSTAFENSKSARICEYVLQAAVDYLTEDNTNDDD